MKVFDELSEGSFISINLIGNDISCTCDTLKFLTWMQSKQRKGSRIRFMNFEKYTCFSANSRQKNFINISEIILELQKNCSSKTAVYVVSGFVLVLFIVIVIAGILYRYRWKLRYIYHMTRRSLRGYFLLQNQDGSEIKCFEFDAFVSYAEEDTHFGHDTLKSKVLSKYPSAKLCYHKEHFLPGRSIPESIVNAVNCSRKTVCVLSEHFLASEWCIYEFKMANLEKIYKRCDQNSLLVLKFGNVNLDSLPADIMIYLKSRSYMEIPYKIDDSDGFWDLIVNAIMDE
ncbi:hypothetical protein FSP39_010899 [Pinctada imbricata]|uniref:TIR domain-containing protein n=1 Tax=Pinctada imbricata TaxID=66713 RepID=A0AA88XR41_PINIB|nr:hypothetical protein FSP39_010899 [Pinctada imbricata]